MPKLTAMMIVRNEEGRYLKRCLQSLTEQVDEIIVLDDASIDLTPEICRSFPNVTLYGREHSVFLQDESSLRRELWERTVASHPEWILAIDADEFLERRAVQELPYLLKQKYYSALSFRLFDCWDSEDYYRTDGLWNPWLRGFSIYIVKYQPHLSSDWPPLKFHCGRFPQSYRKLTRLESDLRIKHLGWAKEEERQVKYKRAIDQDPTFIYMNKQHYESIILSPEKIILRKWIEQD
jgi:glycosyltransferase involved in cell wall biosynthesis